jgi:hypothetical protein
MVAKILAERDRARRDPLRATEFRDEAARKILPALDRVNVHPDAAALLRTFLLDLVDRRALGRLPCLSRPTQHFNLCRRLLWAVIDPSARGWLDSSFFKETDDAEPIS